MYIMSPSPCNLGNSMTHCDQSIEMACVVVLAIVTSPGGVNLDVCTCTAGVVILLDNCSPTDKVCFCLYRHTPSPGPVNYL